MILAISGTRTDSPSIRRAVEDVLTASWSAVSGFPGGDPISIGGMDFDTLHVGDCATGVDAAVVGWCEESLIPLCVFPADWDRFGRQAGPIRNTALIESADALLAFPLRGAMRGTGDAIAKARQKWIPLFVFPLEGE